MTDLPDKLEFTVTDEDMKNALRPLAAQEPNKQCVLAVAARRTYPELNLHVGIFGIYTTNPRNDTTRQYAYDLPVEARKIVIQWDNYLPVKVPFTVIAEKRR